MARKQQSHFSELVCKIAASIPPGKVITYGLLARAAGGGPQAARSITAILAKAPNRDQIPFHRIIYSDGRIWSSPKYDKIRRKLYKQEGIELDENNRVKNFRDILYLG